MKRIKILSSQSSSSTPPLGEMELGGLTHLLSDIRGSAEGVPQRDVVEALFVVGRALGARAQRLDSRHLSKCLEFAEEDPVRVPKHTYR